MKGKTSTMVSKFRSGELVRIRAAEDILNSLDNNGTLNGLPFMPEMLEFWGKRYRVLKRVVQFTIDAYGMPFYCEPYVREFKNNDVVFLEGSRCSGVYHGGCQRGCRIFWKQSWLEKAEETGKLSNPTISEINNIKLRLKTKTGSEVYFCQSSELKNATDPIPSIRRILKCFSSVCEGNYSGKDMLKGIAKWSKWKIHRKLMGVYPHGKQKITPTEQICLQSGDMVEVKSLKEIIKTLDGKGLNRGLHFSADMIPFCGKQFRVRSRADRLITEGTGKMRKIPDTVILEDVTCDGFFYAFGGCQRDDFQYWREIWLKKVE